MKKITRASIVGVAGLGLLAGGATFAVWSSDADIPGATINSGTLTLSEQPGGGWTDVTDANNPTPIDNFTDYEVVPGSLLEYTGDYMINASGDNLEAALGYTDVGLAAGSDEALSGAVTYNTEFTLEDGAVADNITSDDNGAVVTVSVTVDVDPNTADEIGQGETITLENGGVTLTQVNPRVEETPVAD